MLPMRRDQSLDSLEDPLPTNKEQALNMSPSSVVSDPNKLSLFYVMEWLEKTSNDVSREQAYTIVDSPTNNSRKPMIPIKENEGRDGEIDIPIIGVCLNNLFNKNPTTPPRHPSSRTGRQQPSPNSSPFRKRSEAIGNGWNAKGLQRAKKEEWEQAVICWENALKIRVQVLGENHGDVANTLNNMGIALGRLNRYEEALDHLNRALKIRTLQHGSVHLEIAATLHNFGNIFQQMDDYDGALRCFERAKHIQMNLLGHADILVARTASAIGHLNYEFSQYDKAVDAYNEARHVFNAAGIPGDNEEYQHLLLDIEEAEEAHG